MKHYQARHSHLRKKLIKHFKKLLNLIAQLLTQTKSVIEKTFTNA